MIEFLKTPAGKRFFDRDVPALIKAINRVGAALENSQKADLLKDWSGQLGVTQEGRIFPQPRVICTTDPVHTGMTNATKDQGQELEALMAPVLDKMKAEGITVDQAFVAQIRAEVERLKGTGIPVLDEQTDGVKAGEMWNPPGYKPIKLDESDITSAPQDAKRRALFLALDNWIQSCPGERAEIVEKLRHNGMAGQRAATILALFVQFEDVVREALLDG